MTEPSPPLAGAGSARPGRATMACSSWMDPSTRKERLFSKSYVEVRILHLGCSWLKPVNTIDHSQGMAQSVHRMPQSELNKSRCSVASFYPRSKQHELCVEIHLYSWESQLSHSSLYGHRRRWDGFDFITKIGNGLNMHKPGMLYLIWPIRRPWNIIAHRTN